jgi:predicted NBD/HSP70 family sugar kinase
MLDKATRAQVKRHNRRLVLRALYHGLADSRAGLANETGLTKPTIGTIISELMEQGYVEELGLGTSSSSGGKRPTLLRFVANARQVIGVSLTSEELIAGLAYLDGSLIARHHIDVNEGDDFLRHLQHAVNALLAQCDSLLLCLGIGVQGVVNESDGIVINSPMLGWKKFPLALKLREKYKVPVYVGNNTEFATQTYAASNNNIQQLVTVSIGDTIEIGSTFGGDTYQHGGNVALLENMASLEWRNIRARAHALIRVHPNSILASRKFSFLLLKRGIYLQDPAALQLLDEIASILSRLYAWIIALMRPSELVLAGAMSDVGDALLELVHSKLRKILPETTMQNTRLRRAASHYLSMQGALTNALAQELGVL